MAWVATAVVGAEVLGGGAQIYAAGAAVLGGGAQIYAAHESSGAVEDASERASDTQLEMFYQGREDTAPWREAGESALGRLEENVLAGPGEFKPSEDPGYKFGYEEFVQKPLLRGAAAGGRLGGGRTQKELTRYASDYASTKYDNFLDRWYQSIAPDQSMAGVGQTTASQGAQNAMAVGGMVGQNQLEAGNARATGYQQMGNAVSSMIQGGSQNALTAYYMGGGGGSRNGVPVAPTAPTAPTQTVAPNYVPIT